MWGKTSVRTAGVAVMILSLAAVHLALPAALTTVYDLKNRFTINVPADWIVLLSTQDRAVSARSPAVPGRLSDTIDVIARDLPRAITPENCAWQAAMVMRFTIHQWTTVREGPGMLAGLPAYSREYTWRTSTGHERRSIQPCVTPERRAFVIVGTTTDTPSDVARDLPELERLMATFRPIRPTLLEPEGPSIRER